MSNENLHKAKQAKNDEFYTRYEDIEQEIKTPEHGYRKHFENAVVYCNCDDPEWSNFWKFFKDNFTELKLKKLISTHYNKDNSPSYKMEYDGVNATREELKGNGDFRSQECIEILKEADIVVTNPPFSIAREAFIPQLIKYKKKFVIIGDLNWVAYKTVFPLFKDNKMFFGYTNVKEFRTPDGTYKKFGNIYFYTNLDIPKRHEPLKLGQTYKGHEERYPKYDNYDAINVDKVFDIPCDYEPCWFKCQKSTICPFALTKGKNNNVLCEQSNNGEMGVPITFMDKHSTEQFELIGHEHDINGNGGDGVKHGQFEVSEILVEEKRREEKRRGKYKRIIIRRLP